MDPATCRFHAAPSEYSDEPYIITRALIEDGNRQRVLDAPLPLDMVYQKMLAKRRRDRYQSMAEVVIALEGVVDQ